MRSLPILLALASLLITALVGAVKVWTTLERQGCGFLRRLLIVVIFVITSVSFGSTITVLAFEGIQHIYRYLTGKTQDLPPTPIPAPTATPSTTPSPYRQCQYVEGEWPCLDQVRDTVPRDNLTMMAKRNYHLSGFVDPMYADAICQANRAFLDKQFYMNIPPEERSNWGNDPCNYLVPGTLLVVPVPPVPRSPRSTQSVSP